MAYSVNNYHVFTAAGLAADDTDDQIYTKIAVWLNSLLSDIGTAEVFDVSDTLKAVRFVFNDVRAGICFGNLMTTAPERYLAGYIYSSDATTLSVSATFTGHSITNIETVYLFVAQNENDCMLHLYTTENVARNATVYHLKCTDSNNISKNIAFAAAYPANSTIPYYTIQAGIESICRIYNESMTNNLIKNLAIGNQTLLTKFIMPYTDCIPEGAYLLTGNAPTERTIFELNGSKFVVPDIFDGRLIIALKLE